VNERTVGQPQSTPRTREAVDWFVQLETDPEHQRARQLRWEEWSARAENRADYEAVIRAHDQARTLPAPPLPSNKELLEDLRDDPEVIAIRTPWSGAIQRLWGRAHAWPTTHRNAFRFWITCATWMALLLALTCAMWTIVLVHHWPSSGVVPAERSYASAPGEQRSFSLMDGSTIMLGGDSALVVQFTERARKIELTHGEALFRVAHDPRRPFIVHAGSGTTTALGTAFEVRLYTDHTQVWVREGSVEVAPLQEIPIDNIALSEAARWIPVRLAGGEEMSYDSKGEASAPRPADPRVAEAWTEGALVPLIYHGRPLPEVIEDVQRYSRRRILLDPAAADLRFSGIVLHVDAWLRDLPEIYPVEVIDCHTSLSFLPECSDPGRVFIRSKWDSHHVGPDSVLR
jgi:transmembrane sensor